MPRSCLGRGKKCVDYITGTDRVDRLHKVVTVVAWAKRAVPWTLNITGQFLNCQDESWMFGMPIDLIQEFLRFLRD